MRKILFIGDSFTWGEGLELYMDKEPFISMRNSHATDGELRELADYKDSEVEGWRVSNRFARYVKGFENYVQETNGGSFQSVARDANKIVENNGFEIGDVIVIQIPPADRSFFHSNVFFPIKDIQLPMYGDILEMAPQNDLHWYFTKKDGGNVPPHVDMDIVYRNMGYLSKIMGYIDVESYVRGMSDVLDTLAYRNTKLFYYSYIWDLMQRFDVYFIGPWGSNNYESFSKCDEFKDKLIPMVYNGKEYDSLQTLDKGMSENNEVFEIAKQYPSTHNNHPTPIAHKIIGESINKYFNDGN